MTSTTADPSRCEFCGRQLERMSVRLGGREVFGGWGPCECEGARAYRARLLAEEAAEREREELERRRRAYGRAGIPRRYLDAESPEADALLAKVKAGRGLYVCGPVGTGKTHLACAVARKAVDAGMGARVTDMIATLAAIRATWGTDRDEADVVARLSRCDLLVIDDLGKEAPTDWALSQAFRVVNDRYESMRPMVVTTQFAKKSELIARLAKNGDQETAVAIVSRLTEACDVVRLDGPDRRLHG